MYKRGTCWEGYVQAGMKKRETRWFPTVFQKVQKK